MLNAFRKLTWLALVLPLYMIGVVGCEQNSSTGPVEDPPVPSGSPNQVNIEGRLYSFEPYLWRDFMPIIVDTSQTALTAAIRIIANDSLQFPDDLIANYIWVVNGEDIWETTLSSEKQILDDCTIEQVARHGPLWETGVEVDVLVRLSNGEDDFILEASDIPIHRTD